MVNTYTNLVDGQWVEGQAGDWIERLNPADTREVVARYPRMSPSDVGAAFEAAERGFETWRRTKHLERGRVLLDAATLLRTRADDYARDITREMGKTLAESKAEVGAAANFFEFYGGLARSPQGDLLADRRDAVTAWTKREPVGPTLLITPWNDPMVTPARKLAPALIVGNSVVLKPATETPVSSFNLVSVLVEAGLPPGVVNTVSGPSSSIGSALVDDSSVSAISFTGSTAAGLELHRRVAGRTVRLQTEMGGKNATIILSDADLDLALENVVAAGCGQSGQRCTATSRILVQQEIYASFIEALSARVSELHVGPGIDSETEIGPLVSESHLDSVVKAVVRAQSDGASVHTGGMRLEAEGLANGHFFAPTVISDVGSQSDTWREEIFGPVLAVAPFEELDEAIADANDSRYGLSASVFTRNLKAAHHAIDELSSGQVAINLPSTGWDVHMPFGGFKESGSPFKEHGVEGLSFYSRIKSVALGYS